MSAEEHLKEIMNRVYMAQTTLASGVDLESKIIVVGVDLSSIYTDAYRALEKVQNMRKRSEQYPVGRSNY
jgi:hypothetical protein